MIKIPCSSLNVRTVSKVAAATIIAGALFGTMPATHAQPNAVPAREEVLRICEQIRESDARKGITRSSVEVAREAYAVAQAKIAPAARPAASGVAPTQANYVPPKNRPTNYAPVYSEAKPVQAFFYAAPSILYASPQNDDVFELNGAAGDYGVVGLGKWKSVTAYGAIIGGGVTLYDHHYFSLETGVYFGDDKQSFSVPIIGESGAIGGTVGVSVKQQNVYVPLYVTYNYIFYFNDVHSLSLRLGPTLGVTYINTTIDGEALGYSARLYSGNNFTFGAGGVFALSWEFEKNWFLEISNRTMVSTSISVSDIGSDAKTGAILQNQTSASIGMKF